MRLSSDSIKSLQILLKELDLNYTDEQAQEAGLLIMRFVVAKAQRKQELIKDMENNNGQPKNTEETR